MASEGRKPSIKALVLNYLETVRPELVDRQVLSEICRQINETLQRSKVVSSSYVLDLLGETQVPIARSLGGLPPGLRGRIHFHDLDAASRSLTEMSTEYEAARNAGDQQHREDCRLAVRKGKDRLKLLLRQRSLSAPKRAEKQEMLQWFLVWLEAPQLFPQWLELRRKAFDQPPGDRDED